MFEFAPSANVLGPTTMRHAHDLTNEPTHILPAYTARGIVCLILLSLAGLTSDAGQDARAQMPVLDEARGVMTMAPLLEGTTPAVVNVTVLTPAAQTNNPILKDPNFRRFFGLPENEPQERQMSSGSGVILDAVKGHVITNHHVIDKAPKIGVTTKDGRWFDAKLVGSDAATDLALLKIEGKNLRQLVLSDSDTLRVGDLVVAIGNPFGLGQTVTSGIISALGRGGLSQEAYEDFIQTDASINPGNSGGALINTKGELIGVNSAILTASGGNIGIGFAVPANMVKAVVAHLLRHGEVRRGRIGIAVQTLTPDLAARMKLSISKGAVIVSVTKGAEAEKAGLTKGDVIVAINGKAIEDAGDVRNSIGLRERGSFVDVTYYRAGEKKTSKVRIGKL